MNFKGNPRLGALLMAIIGAGLMAANHFSITRDGKYYMISLFFGPALVLFGIVGLFAPAILGQSGGIQTGTQSALTKAVGLLVLIIGLGIGWGIAHFYYHIF